MLERVRRRFRYSYETRRYACSAAGRALVHAVYVRQNSVYERVIEASDGIELRDDNRSSYEPRL